MTDYMDVQIAEDIAPGDPVVVDLNVLGAWVAHRDDVPRSLTTTMKWGEAVNAFAPGDTGVFNHKHGWLSKVERGDR